MTAAACPLLLAAFRVKRRKVASQSQQMKCSTRLEPCSRRQRCGSVLWRRRPALSRERARSAIAGAFLAQPALLRMTYPAGPVAQRKHSPAAPMWLELRSVWQRRHLPPDWECLLDRKSVVEGK